MAWRVSKIGFDYDFESFFQADDPETEFYLHFRDHFETDNDFVIVGIESPHGIYQPAFLQEVDRLTETLKSLPHVISVLSPTQVQEPIRVGLSTFKRPLLRWESPPDVVMRHLQSDSARIHQQARTIGNLISPDGRSLTLQVQTEQKLSKQGCDSLAISLQNLKETTRFPGIHIAGRSVAQKYYVDVMQREVLLFVSLGMVLIIVFLWFAFQSLWGILVPLLVVLLSGLWTLGLMELTGKSIDIMTIVLPTIIFVVGMSDVVHILSRYYEEIRAGLSKEQSIRLAFNEVGMATFLTTGTTAIGFLTLTTSSVKPIQDFGLYAAAGVGLAYILAFSLLPAVMVLLPAPKVSQNGHGVFWNRFLHQRFIGVIKNGRWIILGTTLILAGALWGVTKIEVDNLLLEDLAKDDPLRQEFQFFEEHFAGARPFELSIQITDSLNVYDISVQQEVQSIGQYLKESYGVGSLVSSSEIFRQLNRWSNGDQNSFDRLPIRQSELDDLIQNIERFGAGQLLTLVAHPEGKLLRLFGKVPDIGAQAYIKKNAEFHRWFEQTHPKSSLDLHVTGTAQLIDLNVAFLATDMLKGLSIAFLIVGLISGIMFQSFRMILISLVPNMIPLLLIEGIMGWFSIDLKLSTSIIFTIAFGIAVDDTIHFISKLRIQLAKGRSLPYAIKRSFIGTGKAIIITSIILCGGFITLTLSSFLGTFYIGALISLTLLFAVLADLLLLPWLTLMFYSKRE
ncbi:MAG: MMPL family transporter [Flavobacteriales bacterium]|nr:MMPL family transporter [Flavobacteriales bacterium]